MNVPLRVAVVGLGYWGPSVLAACDDVQGVAVTALVDNDAARLEVLDFQARRYRTLLDVPEEDFDAVAICTPVNTHYGLVLKALELGKHVFVEKPMAPVLWQAEEMRRRASLSNLVLMVDHVLVYSPAASHMRRAVRDGMNVLYAETQRTNLGIVRANENVLWSLAPHDLALMMHVFGSEPDAWEARAWSRLQTGVWDRVDATLWFNGVPAHMTWSWADIAKRRTVRLVGRDSAIEWDDTVPTVTDYRIEGFRPVKARPTSTSTEGSVLMHSPLSFAVADFRDSVMSGCEPLANGWQGVQVVKLLTALEEAAGG